MIGVDWGTSSLRAWRLPDGGSTDGAAPERRDVPGGGILSVPAGGFPAALSALVGDWIAAGERRVLLCGMAGSRQGWVEAPYLPCPAGAAELAAALLPVPFPDAEVRLVPGLTCLDASGVPEVMRGEECQLVGCGLSDGLLCLPGSHSKWARLEGGRVAGFETRLTGEAFAALRGHTILGRLMRDDAPEDPDGFEAGVRRSAEAGGLLHHLFGVRALGLFDRLPETAAASYLSGLLIGHELREALPAGDTVHLVGSAPLCALYARAVALCGGRAVVPSGEAAAAGLCRIGALAGW